MAWILQCRSFSVSSPANRSLVTGAMFSGHPLQPLQLKRRKLSSTKSTSLASLEMSVAVVVEHVHSVMNNIRWLRRLLGRSNAESVWEHVGAEAGLLLTYCCHMNWIPEVYAVVDVFCRHILALLRWNNSSPAFWQPCSDVHLQPLLQFCSDAMMRATAALEIGATFAVRSCSMLLVVAISCLSYSWQRAKLNVVNQNDVHANHAVLLVKACARVCDCVRAARSCSNMTLLVSLVTSISSLRLLLECAWTLIASAMQLRSHVAAARDSHHTGGILAAETWAVACAQATSFLLLLHAPVRAELIATLLFDRCALFPSLSCGASRDEMLHSSTIYQRSALTLAHCLDYRGPLTGFQQVVSHGAGLSLEGRFCIMCTVFGLHAWALQPPPTELCESRVDGISSSWSLITSPVLFCCSEHFSLLHHCALSAVSSACRVNVSLIANAIGPAVLNSLGLPTTATVCREDEELALPVVDVAALCAIICCDGGCNWMFANEERLCSVFEALRRTLQFALSPSMAKGSLTKIVIQAFAVFVTVLLDVIAPSSSSRSRQFLRNSLQLPSVELSSVRYMKHAALIDRTDRQLGKVLCACVRAMRSSPSALGETEVCVISNSLMAARDAGCSCLSVINSAWPLLARMVWRASLDTIQFVESLSDVSTSLKEKHPSNLMSVGVSGMGIVIACIVLELRDGNLTAHQQDSTSANQTQHLRRMHTVRDMFPVSLDPIEISSVHVAPYVRALMGQGKTRIPTLILLSQAADDAFVETLQMAPVQEELREAAGNELRVRELLGEVAVVLSKLPALLQFVMSRVVRKIGMQHADAASESCRKAVGTAIVMSCDKWSRCNSMAVQVVGSLAVLAIVQAMVSDADAGSGAFSMHQLPPMQMPPEVREEAEGHLVKKERPNMKVKLKSLVVAAADGTTRAALSSQAHAAAKSTQNFGRKRIQAMLLKLYPHISTHQQHLKVIALSCVREAWIERAMLPLWISVRVMKTQAAGKTSRRRATTMSDKGLLPALLQVPRAL